MIYSLFSQKGFFVCVLLTFPFLSFFFLLMVGFI